MDPPLINETSFSAANPSSYTLAGIWPLSSSVTGGEGPGRNGGGGGLGLRMGGPVFGELDGSAEESTVTGQSVGNGNGGKKRRDLSSEDESSKLVSTTSSGGNRDLNDANAKRLKVQGNTSENNHAPAEVDAGSGSNKKSPEKSKSSEPPKDYIHVRARRGQATDSHSLAERARREKISERMKLLQDLVPGCNKVIGKALVLDEIINYIQSLQCQVEFLSMKLEAVNSRANIHPTIEGFHQKELGAQPFDATGMMFAPQATREYSQGPQSQWLHMQVGGSFERAS